MVSLTLNLYFFICNNFKIKTILFLVFFEHQNLFIENGCKPDIFFVMVSRTFFDLEFFQN